MGKKMYYTEAEVCEKLGISSDELEAKISDGQVRAFQDGVRRMFKAADIDSLVGSSSDDSAEMISLSGDEVTLSEAHDIPSMPTKEDTVITAEGISIFDDEDLDIESADPMAKTQIAPSLEEQLTSQGVGSGSGLLDLTRESDDTSLGAEVLGHIEVEAGLGGDTSMETPSVSDSMTAPAPAPTAAVVVVEAVDPSAGFFSGMIAGGIISALVMMMATVPALLGHVPAYLEMLKNNGGIVAGAGVAIALIGGGIGAAAAKSASKRATA